MAVAAASIGGVAPAAGATPAVGQPPDKKQIAEVAEAARMKYSTGPSMNIDVGALGCAPWNRGKLGLSPFHVSDVVHSITSDGLSRVRYREVCVIKVPADKLEEFRAFNRALSAACPSLPPFSDQMRYACLTK